MIDLGKSKGKRSKTRKKLRKNIRERGKVPTGKTIQDFSEGEKAIIKINPGITEGQPHAKFHGRTGKVAGKQGKSFIVEVKEGNKTKKVISRPEHLEKVKK